MVPQPHHKMFYVKATEQRNKCQHYQFENRRWNIYIVVNHLKTKMDFRSNHYWYRNLLKLVEAV